MPELPEVETVRRGLAARDGRRAPRAGRAAPAGFALSVPAELQQAARRPDHRGSRPARQISAGGFVVGRGAADASRHVGLVSRRAWQRRARSGEIPSRAWQAFGARPCGVSHVERRDRDVQRSAPLRFHEADPAHRAEPAPHDGSARPRAARQCVRRRDAGRGLRGEEDIAESGAVGPEGRRGLGQHLCVRGAAPRACVAEAHRLDDCAEIGRAAPTRGCAGRRHQGGAERRDQGGRLVVARSSPHRRRPRQLPAFISASTIAPARHA